MPEDIRTLYLRDAISGSGDRILSLDSKYNLLDGDWAKVLHNGKFVFFEFVAASTTATNLATHPYAQRPFDYDGTGCWIERPVNTDDIECVAVTLGGVQRTAWPAAGSGSQSMDDVYDNGSEVNVDNTDIKYKLTTGKSLRITDATGATPYMAVDGTTGYIGIGTNSPAKELDVVGTCRASGGFIPGSGTDVEVNGIADIQKGKYVLTLTCGAGTITLNPSYDELAFMKTDEHVTVTGRVLIDSVSSPSGTLDINVPFTIYEKQNNAERSCSLIVYNDVNALTDAGTLALAQWTVALDRLRIMEQSPTGANNSADHIKAGTYLIFTFSFFTDE